jgi:hypothetical protein
MRKFIILLLFAAVSVFSQDGSKYYVSTEAGAGLNRYLSPLSMDGLNKNGAALSLSLYWQPEHLLEAGIETGYNILYTFNNDNKESNASVSLTSIPFILTFRMRITGNIKISAGSGIILLFNSGEALGAGFSSSQLSVTDFIGVQYSYPLTENFRAGAGFNYNYIFQAEESYISLRLTAAYRIFEY